MSEEEKVPKVEKTEEDEDDGDDGPVPDEETTAEFAPIVKLEQVEVKTHEEDEEVIYKQRAKLYLFGENFHDKGTGNKTWKERGIGDFRLLRHKENNRIRALMRQEKTMKVVCNHFVDPRIVLTPNAGSDKSWCWVAFDFAENELLESTFAIRFSSVEIANEFKVEFENAQNEMKILLSGGDSKEGVKEATELTEAIESLQLKPEEKKEDETVTEPTAVAATEASKE